MKLLVPFDGSDHAVRALAHAATLVQASGPGLVHVVHVLEKPELYGEVAVYVSPEEISELQDEKAEAILNHAKELLGDAGAPFSSEVLTGPLATTIAERAAELRCDGIVMGTKGKSAVGSMVFGSTATDVVHEATVPVTLVK